MIFKTFSKLNLNNPLRILKNKAIKEIVFKQTLLKKISLNSLDMENSVFIKELQKDILPYSQKNFLKKKWWKSSQILNKELSYKYNYRQSFFINEFQENSVYFCYMTPNLDKEDKIKLFLTQQKFFSISKILFINKLNSFKFNIFKNIFLGKCCLIKIENFFSKDFNFLDLKVFEKKFFLLGAFINFKFIRPSEIEILKKNSLQKNLIKFLNLLQFQKNKLKSILLKQS